MDRFDLVKRYRPIVAGALVVVVSGCASVNFDRSVNQTNQDLLNFTGGKLELAQT